MRTEMTVNKGLTGRWSPQWPCLEAAKEVDWRGWDICSALKEQLSAKKRKRKKRKYFIHFSYLKCK